MTSDRNNMNLTSLISTLGIAFEKNQSLVGIGTDLCQIQRIEILFSKWGNKIAKRILSNDEYAQWLNRSRSVQYLAKRWAGKESVVKALGIGFSKGLRWREISILNDENGKPYVEFLGQTRALLRDEYASIDCYISLADENAHALGFCVAVRSSLGEAL